MKKLILAALLLAASPAQAIIRGQVVGAKDPLARLTVMIVNSDANGCTGTLIGRHSVVTAAHCVPQGKEVIVAYMNGREVVAFARIVRIVRHPGLVRPDTGKAAPVDVAVLTMGEAMPKGFGPARLAERDLAGGDMALIAGFGRMRMNDPRADGQLRRVTLPVLQRSISGYLLMGEEDGDERQANPSACQGDSGGPVFVPGSLKLAGVLSLVAGENDRMGCGYLTVAMPAASIGGWIRTEVMAGEAGFKGPLPPAVSPKRPITPLPDDAAIIEEAPARSPYGNLPPSFYERR